MRKIICLCLLLAVVMGLTITAHAGDKMVYFTSDSYAKVGSKSTVDIVKTAQSVMTDDMVTSELYNAALEMNMTVAWKCSNGPDKTGKSVNWTAEDAGREYVCRVSFYLDKACTDFVDYLDSEPFIIAADKETEQVKITPEGPFYLTVGQAFKMQLSCNVKGVTFETYRTSLPKGVHLSSDGILSGIPTEEGFTYVTIVVYKNGEMIGDLGCEFYVEAAKVIDPPEITTTKLPDATAGEYYSVQLKCTDPDAYFGEWYNPGKPNQLESTGLIITEHGVLKGTPKKAGTYTFTIYAYNAGGEGYMTLTLVVKKASETKPTDPTEPADKPTEPATRPTAPVARPTQPGTVITGPADSAVADPTNPKQPVQTPGEDTQGQFAPSVQTQQDSSAQQSNEDQTQLILVIVLGVLVIALCLAILFLLKSRNNSR